MNIYNVRPRHAARWPSTFCTTDGGAEKGVAIGYDSRNNSARNSPGRRRWCCAPQGVKAYLFESLRPVPVLSFTIRHLGCIAGVVITASHNPKQYNGYKAYWDGRRTDAAGVRAAGITDRLPGIDL